MRGFVVGAALAFVCTLMSPVLSPAWAQDELPPVHTAIDENGVDLANQSFVYPMVDVSIGQPGQGGLVFGRTFTAARYSGPRWRDNVTGTVNVSGIAYTVSTGEHSETFTLDGGVFEPTAANGATLAYHAGTGTYTYTSRTGTIAKFKLSGLTVAAIDSVEEPNGEKTQYHYRIATSGGNTYRRLQSITNNFGYQLHFDYQSESPGNEGWSVLTAVTAINNAIDYCDPMADNCTGLTQTWPQATYARDGATETITDAGDRETVFTNANTLFAPISIRRPTSSGDPNIIVQRSSFTPGQGSIIESVTYGTPSAPSVYSYVWVDGTNRTATRTNPASVEDLVLVSDKSSGRILSVTDGEGRQTEYEYDTDGRLTEITWPDGTVSGERYTRFTHDVRGNVLTTTQVARSSSGLPDIVTSMAYGENPGVQTCVNQVTCNLPVRIEDQFGYRTQFAYDAAHGGITTITQPAPSGAAPVGSGVRPQTRITYANFRAYYKDASGNLISGGIRVLPVETSACATLGSCDGGADETVVTIGYGVTDGSVANNLLPVTQTAAAGNGSVSATTTISYDSIGNTTEIDGPLSGTADTSRFLYNDARQISGIMGPDPDGAGDLKRRAVRYTFNGNGQVTLARQGTTDGTSWGTFSSILESETEYDFDGRPIRQSQTNAGGATTFSVTQFSYDAARRLDCVALRMNPNNYGNLPNSACTLGNQGAFGPNRITRYSYNDANDVISVTTGLHTADEAVVQTNGFASNSPLQTALTDANGNVVTFVYDGFDRLYRTWFPEDSGGVARYEQRTYDGNSRLVQSRTRAGNLINYTYDNLNRITLLDPPSTASDIEYEWDNFGRLRTTDKAGLTLTFAYDQLSRPLSESSSLGTVASQYDAAGRRTRLTWPDGFYAQYDYNVANDLLAVRENGAASGAGVLAQYSYNNLGQATAISRADGAGAATAYAYDAAGRLQTLTQNLSGTAQDQSISFAYNPAYQAMTRNGTNADYNWSPTTGSADYLTNGLNQYTQAFIFPLTYDANGNFTSGTFTYNALNQVTGGPSSASFSYDGQQRLRESAGTTTTRFQYDGQQIIAEYNASNVLQRRYVPGPGLDNPLTWYEGSGTTDRRWYAADDLGSILAVTNAAGARIGAANIYDPAGNRGVNNSGRFQFTGQPYIPESGLYNYRARDYHAGIGRFAQPDPILWAGGMNLYAYVGNDPVNLTDSLGLKIVCDLVGDCHDTDEIIIPAPCAPPTCYASVEIQRDILSCEIGCFIGEPADRSNPPYDDPQPEKPDEEECEALNQDLVDQMLREQLAENGGRNVAGWWGGVVSGLGRLLGGNLGSAVGVGAIFVDPLPGGRDYAEIAHDAVSQQGAIQLQMQQMGCNG